MAFVLNTLHIFGYGETQIIGKDGDVSVNKKVATSGLLKAQAVVDDVYSKKPAENTSPNEYRAINVFNKMFADYHPSADNNSWRVKWAELNHAAVDELVAEVLAK